MARARSIPTPQADGRNVEHESFLVYRNYRWLKVASIAALAMIVGYIIAPVSPRPNGGTWYGYTLGTIGAVLILWLTMLGVRKRRFTPGRWSLRGWTSAHVYLGLLLIVVGTLHSGFQFGWNVHTLAYALMTLVILSGLYGVIAYSILPEKLSTSRGEMTREEMVANLAAIDRQLEAAAQPLGREDVDAVIAVLEEDPFRAGPWARLSGSHRGDRTQVALRQISASMSSSYTDDDAQLRRVRGLLERRASQTAQIRDLMRIKGRMEVWLFLHIPLTVALLGALTAHVVSVFYYW